jgi:hypothetical protein
VTTTEERVLDQLAEGLERAQRDRVPWRVRAAVIAAAAKRLTVLQEGRRRVHVL